MPETLNQWLYRETRSLLHLWATGALTDDGMQAKLLELGWTLEEVERITAGAYLLLPVM